MSTTESTFGVRLKDTTVQRIEIEHDSFKAYLERHCNDAKATKVVRSWAGPLFKGASYKVVHLGGQHDWVSWNDVAGLFGLPLRKDKRERIVPPIKQAAKPRRKVTIKPANVVAIIDARAAAPHHLDAEIAEIEAKAARPVLTSVPLAPVAEPAPAPSAPAPRAAPSWLAMSRFRAPARSVARMPQKAVVS
jgi:hypothetical protein